MKLNDIITEAEKTRLDPKCWTGKKIGNPKTKVKGGVRVNNCVPAESVEEGVEDLGYNAQSLIKKLRRDVEEKRLQPTRQAVLSAARELAGDMDFAPELLVQQVLGRGMAEGGTGSGRPDPLAWDTTSGKVGRVEKTSTGIRHHADPSRYGGSEHEIDPNTKLDKNFINKFEKELDVKWPREKKYQGNIAVDEAYNPEYDDEAGMADNNLETLKRTVQGIDDLIGAGDNLPEWCQEKIAVAKSMLVAVWDYMESEEESEEDPEIAEMYEAMESLAEEIAHEDQISVDQVWETLERLDDRTLFETAAWRRKAGKSAKGGLNAKGVASYRRENPGSKLQMAVTTKPSKLKPGSKAAKRRKSFCARMSGVKGPMKKPNGKPTRKALALRKWNC